MGEKKKRGKQANNRQEVSSIWNHETNVGGPAIGKQLVFQRKKKEKMKEENRRTNPRNEHPASSSFFFFVPLSVACVGYALCTYFQVKGVRRCRYSSSWYSRCRSEGRCRFLSLMFDKQQRLGWAVYGVCSVGCALLTNNS